MSLDGHPIVRFSKMRKNDVLNMFRGAGKTRLTAACVSVAVSVGSPFLSFGDLRSSLFGRYSTVPS